MKIIYLSVFNKKFTYSMCADVFAYVHECVHACIYVCVPVCMNMYTNALMHVLPLSVDSHFHP